MQWKIQYLMGRIYLITEVTKSQRNRRRQRRLQIFQKNFMFKAGKINAK